MRTFWIAIGTVAAPADLLAVLDELRHGPGRPPSVGCLGGRTPLDGMRRAIDGVTRPALDVLALLDDVEPIPTMHGGVDIVATRGRFLAYRKGTTAKPADQPGSGACWLTPVERTDLMAHMQQGHVAVLAEASCQLEWKSSMRTFLRYSTSPVLGLVRNAEA
jgi:hypothetical protein